MPEAQLCTCCGKPLMRGDRTGIHFICWEEHHSDPTTEWPPGHKCKLDKEN